ncbi:ABC transporter ATP-binding protein [Verticiella sediminum]|uniref:ABC transporter ATP-binding protein n=1 Tax=Verticiella sediminum TaxID=1247510 RepID=A0A556A7B5_9BURK|nr:ABC transporter ATP-binding protein [Verticiella sediminum]TSH88764.1 ABC transporter ATP-binding protein [Verticiella sediminum]
MLDIRTVAIAYAAHPVVHDFSLHLGEGQIGCLLGASGCGKTTVLRAIAGFEPVRAGEIHLGGERVAYERGMLSPEERRVGVVFQDYALFPHLTVAQNVAFGLRRLERRECAFRVEQMLELVGLSAMGARYPHELSGGQQQRVALARALAPAPRLMLMDEPFSNLDVTLRERLADEVRGILKQAGATAILVTHDQREAFAIADQVGVMAEGRLLQWDTPYALYHHPADRYVAGFVGEGALLPGTRLGDGRVRTELGTLRLDAARAPGDTDDVDVLIRPDALRLQADESAVQAEVVHRVFRGAEYLYTLQLPSGHHLLALAPSRDALEVGARTPVRLNVDTVCGFAAQ